MGKRERNSNSYNSPVANKPKTIHSGRLILVIHLSINEDDQLYKDDSPKGLDIIKDNPKYTKYFSISTENETIVYMFFKILVQIDVNMKTQIGRILNFALLQKQNVHDIVIYINKTQHLTYLFNEVFSKSIKSNEDYSNISIISVIDPVCGYISTVSAEYQDFLDSLDDSILDDEQELEKHTAALSNILIPVIPSTSKPFRKIINLTYGSHKLNTYTWSHNKLHVTLSMNCKFYDSSQNLLKQIWMKELLQQPPCAQGRLKQYSGTCWFNTILHSLILSPRLSKKSLELWKEFENSNKEQSKILKIIPFPYGWNDVVDDTNRSLFIFYIIYNMLDMKYKPDYESDIPAQLAEKCSLIKNKASGSIELIINTLFPVTSFMKDIYDDSVLSLAFSNYQTNNSNKTIILDDIFNNKTYDILLLKFHKNHIRINKLPKVIKISSNTYTLECGGLRPRPHHVISGIICNDSKNSSFIYDSNNILTITNWFDGDLGTYYAHTANPQEENYPELTYAIYIKLI